MSAAAAELARPRLFGLAYRILGSVSDAEDAVQEAYLRWSRQDASAIADPTGWLVTVTARVALDAARRLARERERERYVGIWLPEPIVGADPAEASLLADDLSIGFLLVLERLGPDERIAFLLHDAFGYPFAEIATILGKTETAVRQLAVRARTRIRSERPRRRLAPEAAARAVRRLRDALERGDENELRAVLAADIEHRADGGGGGSAGINVVVGRERVARLFAALRRRRWAALHFRAAPINGTPGIVVEREDGTLVGALALDIAEDGVAAIYLTIEPKTPRRLG